MVPVCCAVTVIATEAVAPSSICPRSQETTCVGPLPVCEQLPREEVTETNPCGPDSWFVSFTLFAVDGPLFTTVTVNVRLLPTATAGTAAIVIPTSAAG